jgi:hypothetical protein
VSIDDDTIALDGIDYVRCRPHPFICDRRVERREINWPHRLRAEHEWVVM